MVVLYAGQVCEQGSTTELFATPYHPYTIMLIGAVLSLTRRPMQGQPNDAIDGGERVHGGCPFRHRCPVAIPQQCADVAPPWQQVSAVQAYRCHHPPHILMQLRQQHTTGARGHVSPK